VAIRNIRRDEVDHVRKTEKDGEVGSDELDRGLAAIQKITDRFVARVDEVAHKKEQEILEV
jgi:ribosome recycling factor